MLTALESSTQLELGRVVRAHGLRGGLSVALHWKGSDGLDEARRVVLRVETRPDTEFDVRRVSGTGAFRILELEGIVDRTQAESYAGAKVLIARSDLPPLEPGEYYLADLVGATVAAPDGVVGRVVEIAMHPSVDALVIETPDGGRVEQPLLDHWVERVDVANALVHLASRDGLV
jgi:16S rRNA processing protein RimM